MTKVSRATSGSIIGDCGTGSGLESMLNCQCVDEPTKSIPDDYDYDDEDYEDDYDEDDYYEEINLSDIVNIRNLNRQPATTQGRIAINTRAGRRRRNSAGIPCPRGQAKECGLGKATTITTTTTLRPVSTSSPVAAGKEVCADYNVRYSGGGQLARFDAVENADRCRSLCQGNGRCKYWTWKGDTKRRRCVLVKNEGYRAEVHRGSVSGTLVGACSNIALSQLTKCQCYDHVKKQDEDPFADDYEEVNLSDLIDIR